VSDLRQRWEDAGVNGEMLLAIIGLIMLLCAVNIANLLLARGAQRERELSIRLSLGADRWQLFQHLFAESVVLGIAGLAFGLMIGDVLIQLLPSLFVQPPNMHAVFTFALSGPVMLVSTLVGLLTTFLFGCFPAMRTAISARARILPVSASGAQRQSLQVHRWLVVTQVSISLVLLVGAGLVVRSFWNTRTGDLGIARRALLNVWMTAPIPEQPPLLQTIRENLGSIPGVRRVAFAVRAPLSLSSGGMAHTVEIPDAPQPPGAAPREILYNSVSANYLEVIGTPVLRGRGFQDIDERPGSNAVVINETMARTFWKSESPLDRIIKIGKAGKDYRVVGVAQDAPIAQLGDQAVPYMYVPFSTDPEGEQTFILEVDGDAGAIASVVRSRLTQLHSNIVLLGMTTEGELIRYAAGEYQLTAALVSALGLLAMCLTAAGLYGAVSYAVTRRTKEIGIRMALGASRRDALLLVTREVGRIALLGLVFGIPATLVCTRLSSAAFFGIQPWHLPTLVSVTGLVTAVLFVAGFGPAYRASRIDPMVAIRQE
jgi:putative ABC transport system permease protein